MNYNRLEALIFFFKMTKEELKSKFPETYNEIVQEGIMQERNEVQSRTENELKSNEAFNFKL